MAVTKDNPWGASGGRNWLGGGSKKLPKGLSGGFQKTKAAASKGYKKVKKGASVGVNWLKLKYTNRWKK